MFETNHSSTASFSRVLKTSAVDEDQKIELDNMLPHQGNQFSTFMLDTNLAPVKSMSSGYTNINLPVAGHCSAYWSPQSDLAVFENKFVTLSFQGNLNASTHFDQDKRIAFSLDVGELLADAVIVTAPLITRNRYEAKMLTVVAGRLKPYVSGKYRFNVSWTIFHGAKVDSKFDNFLFSASVHLFGFFAYRALHLLDTARFGPSDLYPNLRELTTRPGSF